MTLAYGREEKCHVKKTGECRGNTWEIGRELNGKDENARSREEMEWVKGRERCAVVVLGIIRDALLNVASAH